MFVCQQQNSRFQSRNPIPDRSFFVSSDPFRFCRRSSQSQQLEESLTDEPSSSSMSDSRNKRQFVRRPYRRRRRRPLYEQIGRANSSDLLLLNNGIVNGAAPVLQEQEETSDDSRRALKTTTNDGIRRRRPVQPWHHEQTRLEIIQRKLSDLSTTSSATTLDSSNTNEFCRSAGVEPQSYTSSGTLSVRICVVLSGGGVVYLECLLNCVAEG